MDSDFLARSRVYQQRSRARKQSLLANLQSRVAEYERAGVQASIAMQMTAQRVDRENKLLSDALSLLQQQHCALQTATDTLREENSALNDDNSELRQALHETNQNVLRLRQEITGLKAQLAQNEPHEKDVWLETECDVAADILVGLHTDTGANAAKDRNRLREAMGCTGVGSCSVSNTRVFELMDKTV